MSDYPTVMEGGVATHVLVPMDEFQRIQAERHGPDVAEALRMLDDPNTVWHDNRSVMLSLGVRIIAATRALRDMSQQQLAEATDMNQATISRIEKEPSKASVDQLQRIAKALDIDLTDIVRALT